MTIGDLGSSFLAFESFEIKSFSIIVIFSKNLSKSLLILRVSSFLIYFRKGLILSNSFNKFIISVF